VKNLRVLILVLLAVLLPVRGALAAALFCPGGGQGRTAVVAIVAVEQGQVAIHADQGMHDEQATAHHHPSAGDAPGRDTSASGGQPPACQACASACCMSPLAFAPPPVEATVSTTSVSFPAISAPSPDFHSGGQDRPPRII